MNEQSDDAYACRSCAYGHAARRGAVMRPALALILILQGTAAHSAPLLQDEPQGFAADFTQTNDSLRIAVRDGSTLTTFSPDDFLTNSTTSLVNQKQLKDAAGNWFWVAHNIYWNSDTPATQTRTVVSGAEYTVRVTGSGSLPLTGAGAGTATEGNDVTFTASSASLISTKTGTLTTMQLNRGPVATAYLATAGAPRNGVPIGWDAVNSKWALIVEPTRVQHLISCAAPVTETISLAAGTHIVWVEGSGSYALSGGPTGTATEGSPVTFTLGGTTSVTFTKTGTLTKAQVETGSVPTSFIERVGADATRYRDYILFDLSQIPELGAEFSAYVDFVNPDVSVFSGLLSLFSADFLTNKALLALNSIGSSEIYVTKASVAQADLIPTVNGTITPDVRNELSVSFKTNALMASVNGGHNGGSNLDYVCDMPAAGTLTLCEIGCMQGAQFAEGPLHIFRVVISNRAVAAVNLAYWITEAANPSEIKYKIILDEGQSNAYWGLGFDAGIDLSHAKIDCINQLGVVESQAVEPMPYYAGEKAGAIGHTHTFARDYWVTNVLAAGERVMIVPVAASGTGFGLPGDPNGPADSWSPGQPLNLNAMSLVGQVIGRFPNSTVDLIVSARGENEAFIGTSEVDYAEQLDAMIADWRVQLDDPRIPVIVTGMSQEWVNTGLVIPSAPTIGAAGATYSVNDVLTFVGGTFATAATYKATAVDGSGAVTALLLVDPGNYSVLPSSPAATTGGTGTGCTIGFTASSFQYVQDALINTPSRLFLSAYADANYPSMIPGDAGVGGLIHYAAAGQRTLAARMWDAWQRL